MKNYETKPLKSKESLDLDNLLELKIKFKKVKKVENLQPSKSYKKAS